MVHEQNKMCPMEIASLPEIESASGSAVQNTNNVTTKTNYDILLETTNDLSLEPSTDPTLDIEIDPITGLEVLTKLTDLPKRCMYKVLRHLSFVDLVHVADLNSELKQHACRVFRTKFLSAITYAESLKVDNNWSDEIFLSAVNAFGPLIHKITIEFTAANQEINAIILKTVTEKCCLTLKYLKLSEIPSGLILEQTFPSINKLVFSNIHNDVHESWSNLSKHFPNVRTLALQEANGIIKNEQFLTHIPKLERLICSIQSSASCISEATHFAEFLNKNSHITDLNLKEVGNKESNMEFVKLVKWDELKVINFNIDGSKVTLAKTVCFKYLQTLQTNHFVDLDYLYSRRTLRELNYTIDCLDFNSYGFILQFLCLKTLKLNLTASKIKYKDMELFANNLILLTEMSVITTTCIEDTYESEGPISMRKFISNTFNERNKYCTRLETIKFEYPVKYLKSTDPELQLHIDLYRCVRNLSGWKFRYVVREQSFEKSGYHRSVSVTFSRP